MNTATAARTFNIGPRNMGLTIAEGETVEVTRELDGLVQIRKLGTIYVKSVPLTAVVR